MKTLTSLELFILSCFDRGLETPYDLSRVAGLSLGATNPALKRLVKSGLLKRSTGASVSNRPRHEYTLTPDGRQAARNGWKASLGEEVPPSDLDSILRIVDMASHYKSSASSIHQFLVRAMESRKGSVEVYGAMAEQAGPPSRFLYARLKVEFEKERLLADFKTIGTVLTWLKQRHRPKVEQASIPGLTLS